MGLRLCLDTPRLGGRLTMPGAQPRPDPFDAVGWSRRVEEQLSSGPRKTWTARETREAAERLGLRFVPAPQRSGRTDSNREEA